MSGTADPGAGPRWFFANLVEVKLSGPMSIVEISCPPGDMPPLHRHQTDDEAWVVLDGEMTFFVDDSEPVAVRAGGAAFGPNGLVHTYRAGPDGARCLTICTSGDFANFVLAASQPAVRPELPPAPPGPPSADEVASITALAGEHGIELLGPPGALPGDAPAG